MYRIVRKKVLNPTVVELHVEAPLVANKAKPGQFIILRVDEEGERIPLTVAGVDKAAGTVKIIYQVVGATTEALSHKEAGDYLQDFLQLKVTLINAYAVNRKSLHQHKRTQSKHRNYYKFELQLL